MSTDFRALCAELAAELDHNRRCLLDDASVTHPLADRARAALAEPADAPAAVTKQPSDEELIDFQNEWFQSGRTEIDVTEFQRATLARWGQPPAPPAERHAAPVPVAVSERLPEPSIKVLAYYLNSLGKGRTVCAIWVPAKTRSDSDCEDDFTEYDEETDKFYWPEGWYEQIENWEDLGWVRIYEGEVVYWQPLPKWPAHAIPLPAPQGGEVGA